jgi:hypothetical protein
VPREISQHVVFVAGAEDVDHLIVSALRLIASLDKVLCPSFGLSLHGERGLGVAPAGWGRPQDRINPIVKSCDLFIGIISRKFGHPTGIAQSGTVEEFDIAAELRRLTGRAPEILLFFRRLPAGEGMETSEDLQRIREFRHRISEELLWVDFGDDEQFKTLCAEQLVAYVLTKGTFVGGGDEGGAVRPPQTSMLGEGIQSTISSDVGGDAAGDAR